MIDIYIGANRKTLRDIANNLLAACADESAGVNHSVYGHANDSSGQEIVIQFSNDDCENRDDLPGDYVSVDIVRQ